MATSKKGCVAAAAGPIDTAPAHATDPPATTKEAPRMIARIGNPAPDFEATAYIPASNDFQPVRLSDYRGQWIALCFYPGDFTFV